MGRRVILRQHLAHLPQQRRHRRERGHAGDLLDVRAEQAPEQQGEFVGGGLRAGCSRQSRTSLAWSPEPANVPRWMVVLPISTVSSIGRPSCGAVGVVARSGGYVAGPFETSLLRRFGLRDQDAYPTSTASAQDQDAYPTSTASAQGSRCVPTSTASAQGSRKVPGLGGPFPGQASARTTRGRAGPNLRGVGGSWPSSRMRLCSSTNTTFGEYSAISCSLRMP